MKRRTITLGIVIAGFAIGLLFTAQFRADPPRQGSYPFAEWQTAQELITEYLDEQAVLKTTIVTLRGEITQKQEELSKLTDPALRDQLESLKEKLGLTKINGDGVEVVLDDGPASLIHAADLRDMLNFLFSQHVIGIALNGQRIIANSTISTTGTTIVVNTTKIAPPFVFDIVTDDADFLLKVLSAPETLPDLTQRATQEGVSFKFRAKEAIALPVYSGAYPESFLTETK